jgi:hypothetical protein
MQPFDLLGGTEGLRGTTAKKMSTNSRNGDKSK